MILIIRMLASLIEMPIKWYCEYGRYILKKKKKKKKKMSEKIRICVFKKVIEKNASRRSLSSWKQWNCCV